VLFAHILQAWQIVDARSADDAENGFAHVALVSSSRIEGGVKL
jgi:hypothetical protein